MKINGWQRLGIIASAVWILGAGLCTLKAVGDIRITNTSGLTLSCEEAPNGSLQWSAECDALSKGYLAETKTDPWTEATVVAFVPVPLGWGSLYLILFLTRWVKRGFVK
jgi:hypothetical protein